MGFPISDTLGGFVAALGVSAALVRREREGVGCDLDVSMLEATLSTMGWVVSNYLNAGVTPAPMGNENFTAAPSGTFKTGDGLLNIAANETKQFVSLCRLIGRPDLPSEPPLQMLITSVNQLRRLPLYRVRHSRIAKKLGRR